MKKFRKLALIAMIPVLALSVLSVKFIFPGKRAFANDAFDQIFSVNGGYKEVGGAYTNVGWKTEYELSDTFTPNIPANTTLFIYDPNGGVIYEKASGAAVPVTFDMPGYYTAVYKATDNGFFVVGTPKLIPVTREFRFNVVAEDYQLELRHFAPDGKIEPAMKTLVAKGEKFTLPRAQLIYTDKKGEVVVDEANSKNIYVRISDIDNQSRASEKYAFDGTAKEHTAPAKGGKIFITYFYGGMAESASKTTIQKDFTVTVTDGDSINKNLYPSLSASNMSTAYTLMTKVDLPIATATDEQDKNVKIEITAKITPKDTTKPESTKLYTVKDELLDKDMVDAKANSGVYFIKDEYKNPADPLFYASNPANEVKFDNNRNRTFYPHVEGTYVITYKATNQVGNTAEKYFTFNVEDSQKPYIKVKASEIPSKWSSSKVTILEKDINGVSIDKTEEDKADITLKLPRPDFIDNVSLNKDLLSTAEVVVTRGGQSTEVERLKYDGEGKPFKSTNNKITDEGPGVDKYLIISETVLKEWEGADINVRYTVTDQKNRYSELSFAITIMTKEFEDLYKPVIDIKGVNTIKLGTTLAKPVVTVNDSEGALTWETKYILSARTADFDQYKPAAPDLDKDITDAIEELFYKDIIEKFDLSMFAGLAKDYDKLLVQVEATDAAGNVARDFKKIDIVNTLTATPAPVIQTVKMPNGSYAYNKIGPDFNTDLGTDYNTGTKPVVISEIIVYQDCTAYPTEKDIYVGYEFTIRNAKGDIVSTVTEATSWLDTWTCGMTHLVGSPVPAKTTVLHIENFKFQPDSKGKYTITLSVFNVSNATSSITFTVEAASSGSFGNTPIAAKEMPATMEYARIIDLPDYRVTNEDGKIVEIDEYDSLNNDYPYMECFYKKVISGSHYSVQGFELSALKTGSYTITYFCDGKYNGDPVTSLRPEHTIDVQDTSGPSIKLMEGTMLPFSIDVEKTVFIPGFVASDASGINNSNTTEKVKVRNGGTTENAKQVSGADIAGDVKAGWYKFKPFLDNNKKDGQYEITYSAVDNNGQSATLKFTIAIGDIYVPVITLSTNGKTYAPKYNKNANFRFFDFKAEDQTYEKDTLAPITVDLSEKVVITLTAPDGSQPLRFENRRKGYTPDNQDTIKLDKAGEYKIAYTVTDTAGNEGTLTYTFKVEEKAKTTPINPKVLTVILVVAGVLVIAGVVFYFVRYRKKAN